MVHTVCGEVSDAGIFDDRDPAHRRWRIAALANETR
jgi:hypothetical protein